jgi:hypothetical protein
MTTLPSSDDYSDVLVRDVMEATGMSDAEVRGICSDLTGKAMTDKAMQWEICQRWGKAWQQLEMVMSIGKRNIEGISNGLAMQGGACAALSQKLLVEELSAGVVDINRAKAFSSISKQQFDLMKAATGEQPAQQHLHLHGGNNIELLRMLREQKATEATGKERLIARGVAPELLE